MQRCVVRPVSHWSAAGGWCGKGLQVTTEGADMHLSLTLSTRSSAGLFMTFDVISKTLFESQNRSAVPTVQTEAQMKSVPAGEKGR
jgi:hypothetical protein